MRWMCAGAALRAGSASSSMPAATGPGGAAANGSACLWAICEGCSSALCANFPRRAPGSQFQGPDAAVGGSSQLGSVLVSAQAAPLPPNRGGKSIRLPQDWGAGGHSGRYRDHSHCLAEQLRVLSDFEKETHRSALTLEPVRMNSAVESIPVSRDKVEAMQVDARRAATWKRQHGRWARGCWTGWKRSRPR